MLNKTEKKDKPICENFSEYNDVRKNLNNALSIKDPFNHWAFDKVLPKDLVDKLNSIKVPTTISEDTTNLSNLVNTFSTYSTSVKNAIDKYEDKECEDKDLALAELGILVFKTNYYSKKLTSDNENIEAKTDLASSLVNFGLSLEFVAEQMLSMETPKYARLDMNHDEAIVLIKSWI